MTNCVDIMNMRPKKHKKPLVAFLTEEQIEILFSQPDTSTLRGIRDLALMVLL